jgi:predicted Fe-Mo cluster-binding NifX family protein
MNICIPVTQENDLQSRVSGHFGSAPFFAIADTESGSVRTVPNGNRDHRHGRCQPMRALAGLDIDAVVVGGIGAGALSRLQAMGVPVYRAGAETAADALQAFTDGNVVEITPEMACEHHGYGHGHGHGHGAHACADHDETQGLGRGLGRGRGSGRERNRGGARS